MTTEEQQTVFVEPEPPMFDPDRDGKPGLSLPAALVCVALIGAVVVLGLYGELDVIGLAAAVLSAAGGASAMRIKK